MSDKKVTEETQQTPEQKPKKQIKFPGILNIVSIIVVLIGLVPFFMFLVDAIAPAINGYTYCTGSSYMVYQGVIESCEDGEIVTDYGFDAITGHLENSRTMWSFQISCGIVLIICYFAFIIRNKQEEKIEFALTKDPKNPQEPDISELSASRYGFISGITASALIIFVSCHIIFFSLGFAAPLLIPIIPLIITFMCTKPSFLPSESSRADDYRAARIKGLKYGVIGGIILTIAAFNYPIGILTKGATGINYYSGLKPILISTEILLILTNFIGRFWAKRHK